jgi:predicted Zn-dependent protease
LSRRAFLLPLLTALLVLGMEAAASAADPAARRAAEELKAWDVTAARAAVDELAARQPGSEQTRALQAQVLFEEGRYQESVALWDELKAPDSGIAGLARATLKATRKYETRESKHFLFRYPHGKDALLAPYALDTLEKIYEAMKEDLGYAPPNRIPVEVYEDAHALSEVSTLPLEAIKTSGTIAICKFNRLMITSPKALVKGYEWQDTLAHEYVHLVISKKSRDTVPIWIHEGFAKYFESRWDGQAGRALSPASAAFLAQELKKNKLISFERMHPSMALLPSQEDAALAYAEVFTAIEYVHAKGGNAMLVKLIDALRSGADYQQAIGRAVGVPFARFFSDWKSYLARRPHPKDALPLSSEKRRFTEDEAPSAAGKQTEKEREKIRFGDFLEIQDEEGRRLAHLGELMRARNRNKAAVEEFAKAYQRVGNRSPALATHYAQALIKTGELARAEAILRASLEPFPEYARTHELLGQIYAATQRPVDAERAFLAVVGIDPFDPAPHAGLHEIYSSRKDQGRTQREADALAVLSGRAMPAQASPTDGLLVVRSHPYARVVLDGVDTGKTTPARLPVPPGSHVVGLLNEERGIKREEAVEIAGGEEKTLDVALDQAPASR